MQSDEVRSLVVCPFITLFEMGFEESNSLLLFPNNRNQPIFRITLHWLMSKYGELAKLPGYKRHFHVLKHSIAIHLLDATGDLQFVQDWVGYAQIQNTQKYTHLISRIREAKARTAFMKLPRF